MIKERRRPAPTGPRPGSIELHIDELVLYGFSPHDRHAIGDAVARELTRLLAQPEAMNIFGEGRDPGHLDDGAVSILAGSRGDAIGRSVGGAIYRGLKR